MEYDRQAWQVREPELGSHIDGTQGQHARSQRGHAKPSRNGGSHSRNPATNEGFGPRYAGGIEEAPRQPAHAARLSQRREGQGLARAESPARRREPPEPLLRQNVAVVSTEMKSCDDGIEFSPIEKLKQVCRRADPQLDEKLRVLRIHSRDEGREIGARHVVADADRQPLPCLREARQRAIMRLDECAGTVEEDRALRGQLHVAGRALQQSAAEPLFEPFDAKADGSLRRAGGLRCAREAIHLGDVNESSNGVEIEGSRHHDDPLSLISAQISYPNRRDASTTPGGKRRDAMPLTFISMRSGKTELYKQAIFDGLYRAMRETFSVPEDDQFMTITEYDAASFRYGSTYAGIDRTDDMIFIQISAMNTRSVEQKKALYRRIVEILAENPGIRTEDVLINIVEGARENWSLGRGLAQYA